MFILEWDGVTYHGEVRHRRSEFLDGQLYSCSIWRSSDDPGTVETIVTTANFRLPQAACRAALGQLVTAVYRNRAEG